MNTSTPSPFIPDNAPFSTEQRAWLNGFLAGMYSSNTAEALETEATSKVPVTLLFGSQTGTSEGLAKQAVKQLNGVCEATVLDMADCCLEQLAKTENLLLITSTYGEGEPPDNAKAFHSALMDTEAPRLEKLRYSVLGLGDSSYPDFCQCSKELDTRLESLGAQRIAPTVECDGDPDEPFEIWIKSLQEALQSEAPQSDVAEAPAESAPADEKPVYSKKNPFPARCIESINLNGSGSAKATHHVAIDLQGSGLEYIVGDALGVLPRNSPSRVKAFLDLLSLDGKSEVTIGDENLALEEALASKYDLRNVNGLTINKYLEIIEDADLEEIATDRELLNAYMYPRELYDLLARHPEAFDTAEKLLSFLKKLQPRLYSISSSPKAHPGEVHLTVGVVRYQGAKRELEGICSCHLAQLDEGDTLEVFTHTNKTFRLPEDDTLPVIMVGPGTGIAPFRAFLEEREARAASGKNWLFFGDQRIATDFLYQEQIERYQKSGLLTRLDTAFSRDQEKKVYVQHRMKDGAAELFQWLEAGGYFYVCGDASRMAKDVEQALLDIIASEGKCSPEEAAEYLANLKKEKRYLRDVY